MINPNGQYGNVPPPPRFGQWLLSGTKYAIMKKIEGDAIFSRSF